MLNIRFGTKRVFRPLMLLALLALFATACAAADSQTASDNGDAAPDTSNTGEQVPTPGNEARVEFVELVMLESFPVQVDAKVSGLLLNTCVEIDEVNQQRNNNAFLIGVTTKRTGTAGCVDDQRLFQETVSLDVANLSAGPYTVTANGINSVSNWFELRVDNVPQTEVNPAAGSGNIRGVIWEDACQVQDDGSVGAGCVVDEAGNAQADGIRGDEERVLGGVTVVLQPGVCAANDAEATTTVTDGGGQFQFSELQPGPHCLTVSAFSEENAEILTEGGWTYPEASAGNTVVLVEAGQTQTADFGWNFQLETVAEGGEACADSAAYVDDVTIPDDTEVPPGEAFVKTWRIRNEGNCPWGPGYAFAFEEGEPMEAPEFVPLSEVVQPGTEVDISVSMVAPTAEGSYQSDWKLQNGDGERFGSSGDFSFYVRIIVSEAAAPATETEP